MLECKILFIPVKINNRGSPVAGCPVGLTFPKVEGCQEGAPPGIGSGGRESHLNTWLVSSRYASCPAPEPQLLSGG